MSADGRYVAFVSGASDLVSGDGNGELDVFVRDLQAGITTRVSVDTAGGDPNGFSTFPSISANGRHVAFHSQASDLVAGDSNSTVDVFLRDLQTGTTTRVSVDTTGGDANDGSFVPSISADGRYVAFYSHASDLIAGDGNGPLADVFVRDLRAGTTTRATVDTTGGDPDSGSFNPSISADGRYVVFHSQASDLVSGDSNSALDVFVRDLQTSTTEWVSVDRAGGVPDNQSLFPSISGNGRYVVFISEASDLVSGRHGNLYVRDLQSDITTAVDLDTRGGDPDSGGDDPSISGDGRYVTFSSDASDLVPGDTNNLRDVFLRDIQNATTTRVSVTRFGGELNASSGDPSISADARYVAFESLADNLAGPDNNGTADLYVRAVPTPTIDSITPSRIARGTTATRIVTGNGFLPGAQATASAFTQDGVTVNSVTVNSETELEVSLTVDADAPTGTRHLAVWNPGTGPGTFATTVGFCADCLTVT